MSDPRTAKRRIDDKRWLAGVRADLAVEPDPVPEVNAAWEALFQDDIYGYDADVEAAFARHRPIIEAAILATPPEPKPLDDLSVAFHWRSTGLAEPCPECAEYARRYLADRP
jgi:hypothetical protein